MTTKILYKFLSPQASRIIEKILEINIIEFNFKDKLTLSNPNVPCWSYTLYFEQIDLPCQKSFKPEFNFSLGNNFLLNQLQVAVIDTDDCNEICRLIIEGSS